MGFYGRGVAIALREFGTRVGLVRMYVHDVQPGLRMCEGHSNKNNS